MAATLSVVFVLEVVDEWALLQALVTMEEEPRLAREAVVGGALASSTVVCALLALAIDCNLQEVLSVADEQALASVFLQRHVILT